VGRSHHKAYAYLVVKSTQSITENARKRLDAIASLEELGAGFMLANHDLEIRGAGDLLGENQRFLKLDLIFIMIFSGELFTRLRITIHLI
jgi:transcription-repair coupling factor (superfamily II helicase)